MEQRTTQARVPSYYARRGQATHRDGGNNEIKEFFEVSEKELAVEASPFGSNAILSNRLRQTAGRTRCYRRGVLISHVSELAK